jgi:O-methyltransferase
MISGKIRGLKRRLVAAYTERAISPLSRNIRSNRLTYLTPGKLLRIERFLQKVLKDKVEGDVIELGVYLGGSSILLATQAAKSGRKFYGFDVFTMIPEPSSDKDDKTSKDAYQKILSGNLGGIGGDPYYGHETDFTGRVKDNFARFGLPIDDDRRTLCKGLFEETLPHYSGPVAFAHIDCDWYDPVKYSLQEVSKRLSSGGVMILDDYHAWAGARKATDEFLSENPKEYCKIDGENVALIKLPH